MADSTSVSARAQRLLWLAYTVLIVSAVALFDSPFYLTLASHNDMSLSLFMNTFSTRLETKSVLAA